MTTLNETEKLLWEWLHAMEIIGTAERERLRDHTPTTDMIMAGVSRFANEDERRRLGELWDRAAESFKQWTGLDATVAQYMLANAVVFALPQSARWRGASKAKIQQILELARTLQDHIGAVDRQVMGWIPELYPGLGRYYGDEPSRIDHVGDFPSSVADTVGD
jgi:hypothetical protein